MGNSFVKDIEAGWRNNLGDCVAYIPDLRILEYMTPEECLSDFKKDWGETGKSPAVCLPLVGIGGVAYKNHIAPEIKVQCKIDSMKADFKSLGQIAADFNKLGCDLYLYVNPIMQFLEIPSTHVLDNKNEGSPMSCVHKKKTREFVKYLIALGIIHVSEHFDNPADAIKGIVMDITDLWGMGAEDDKLTLTCFCEECREYFSDHDVNLSNFNAYPNPWNLALKDSGTGVSYMDNISYGEIANSIVGKSSVRGFDGVFGSEKEKLQAAENLMAYMKARHDMVEDFLVDVFHQPYTFSDNSATDSLKRIAIVEGTEYDWTAGVFPGSLKPSVLDELWLDPSDKAPSIAIPYKSFMWRRATYFINAFFDYLTNAASSRMRTTTGLARLTKDEMKEKVGTFGRKALNSKLKGIGPLAALPELKEKGRRGTVGVVFGDNLLNDLQQHADIAEGLSESRGGQNGLKKLLAEFMSSRTD